MPHPTLTPHPTPLTLPAPRSQAQFKASQEAVELLKEESAPELKLLKAASPKADKKDPAAAAPKKDEV